jgi:DNA ligase-associated metallophosphoesterase
MSQLLTVASEALLLLPQKAVYWPRERMLIVADIHFGKAAAFRAQGVPVPSGTTSANLRALDELMARYAVRHIMFLGDFLHARTARAPATLAAMQAWRERHPSLQLTLVRGNHDVHAGDPPSALRMDVVDEPHIYGPFAFCHHPDLAAPAYVLAGHVHPVYCLRSGWEAVMLPCFVAAAERLLLPSFGAFTGGHVVTPQPGQRLFVTSGEAVLAIP